MPTCHQVLIKETDLHDVPFAERTELDQENFFHASPAADQYKEAS